MSTFIYLVETVFNVIVFICYPPVASVATNVNELGVVSVYSISTLTIEFATPD